MGAAVALTGTPGTGKSAVGRLLGRSLRVIEVTDLAHHLGAARGRGRNVEVDLGKLVRAARKDRTLEGYDVVVGHLAHFLPVSGVAVLRCHPIELRRRLGRARRGTPAERQANLVCEATDLILSEARATGRPVFEIDTTHRSVAEVAAEVRRWIRRGGPPRWGTVGWLADPRVTAHLLDRPR